MFRDWGLGNLSLLMGNSSSSIILQNLHSRFIVVAMCLWIFFYFIFVFESSPLCLILITYMHLDSCQNNVCC